MIQNRMVVLFGLFVVTMFILLTMCLLIWIWSDAHKARKSENYRTFLEILMFFFCLFFCFWVIVMFTILKGWV